MPIALIGMPGSGKSTVGRQLAKRLGVPFLDSDAVIEARIGTSIRDYFEANGESAFRDIEQLVLDELTRAEPAVLATGGGAILREANRIHLRNRCTVVYLRSDVDDLYRRMRRDTQRPLLQVRDPLALLRELHDHRHPLYQQVAHYTVETGRPSVASLVGFIASQLELAGAIVPPA